MARLHRTSVIGRAYHYVANCWCGWEITSRAQQLARQRAKQHETKKNQAR